MAKKITSRNPIVNEIVAFRRMDGQKIARLNYNKPGKAVGWLSESRGDDTDYYAERILNPRRKAHE